MKLPSRVQAAYSASDKDWAEAVRREAVIRLLADTAHFSRLEVRAADAFGLSVPRVHRLRQEGRA